VRDALVATALELLMAIGIVVAYSIPREQLGVSSIPPAWVSVVLTAALAGPLAWRRRAPLTVLALVSLAFALFRFAHVPESAISSVVLFVALYTAGAWSDEPRRNPVRWSAVAGLVAVVAWSLISEFEYVNLDFVLIAGLSIVLNGAFFVAAWRMGDMARAQRLDQIELGRRADQLAAEREERARRAVLDERVRIARELHDVVAHHVSVMGVQAAGARRILGSDPDRAAQALAAIEESGRQAVGELQRLVGFLRSGEEHDALAPQPRLDDIDGLLDQMRAAGLPVEKRVVGTPKPLPDSIELSAFRIAQEALTNTMKHAGQVPTTVVLSYTRAGIQVEVVNARGDHHSQPGGGRGLLGMRERVAMVGGRFEAGPTADGGYRVAASLPTGSMFEQGRTSA
jgi:signal transduction histidine kinase